MHRVAAPRNVAAIRSKRSIALHLPTRFTLHCWNREVLSDRRVARGTNYLRSAAFAANSRLKTMFVFYASIAYRRKSLPLLEKCYIQFYSANKFL